ncbi:CDGSH iron-sulfur domain-containing protein [Mesorhizobium muleiense]|uniref:CDGSH iron-sulfur domain-containing protein n=1 Tax=Mesorhizobium muleiense TaxID=1004279 RepID=UPI003AFA0361
MAGRRNSRRWSTPCAFGKTAPWRCTPRSCWATRRFFAPRSAAAALRKTSRSATAATTKSGFTATGEPALKDTPALDARNGPLTVTPTKNGPLKLEGNLEIVTGTGHTVDRTQRTFLCRCGHSANKPFCDGTHKKVGFVG